MDEKKDTGDPQETTLGADLEFCHTANLSWGTGDLAFSTIMSVLKGLRFVSLRTQGASCRASPLLFVYPGKAAAENSPSSTKDWLSIGQGLLLLQGLLALWAHTFMLAFARRVSLFPGRPSASPFIHTEIYFEATIEFQRLIVQNIEDNLAIVIGCSTVDSGGPLNMKHVIERPIHWCVRWPWH